MGLFQYGLEDRLEIFGRRIDDLEHLGGRGLTGQCVVKSPLQLSIGTPKIGHFIIERRGHLRLPVRPAPDRIIPDRHRLLAEKAMPLDHLVVEGVKSARECLTESFSACVPG
jgi:hypothetical protein